MSTSLRARSRLFWVGLGILGLLSACDGSPGGGGSDAGGSMDGDGGTPTRPPTDPPPPSTPPPPVHMPAPVGTGWFDCPTVESPPYTGARSAPAEWDEATRTDVRRAGMAAWRRPDMSGVACADCHGPDGLDLAFLAFSDDDLMRRGDDHVPVEDAEAIIDMVHLLRQEHGIETPCSLDWRVFQPGGEAIPGDTILEREAAFVEVLEDTGLLVATEDRIDDRAEAEAVFAQLVNVDVRRVPIPLELPRWSDDHARGEEYRNINDWITDDGVVPRPEARDAWHALQNTYLDDPSDTNLLALIEAMGESTLPVTEQETRKMTAVRHSLNDRRYAAALVAQHLFRRALRGDRSWLEYGITAFDLEYTERLRPAAADGTAEPGTVNPFGDVGIGTTLSDTSCDSDRFEGGAVTIDCFADVPEGMREELSTVRSIWDYEALGSFSATWGGLSWLWDSSMMTPRRSDVMKYWKQDLRRYDHHLMFTWMWVTSFAAKMQVVASERGAYRPPIETVTHHLLDGYWWRHYFLSRSRDLGDDDEPGRAARNAMARRMMRNMHTAALLLMESFLEAGGTVNNAGALESELDDALTPLLDYPMDDAERERIQSLHDRVQELIRSAPQVDVRTIYS